ncbi:hypothetical protein [Modestobacter sp. VKM Ac-2978]|uniref:hypothetical protein n=1 Tax=Modestobacter sp. VKM Ac-2978 TaxID=3004132 RepID=UPI0022AAD54A|nr:hypothetical protein [Modestobacter sp. VKM Ac-2978]MCZ2848090.1 hypothetical protein [Modestobacter sp. VKM Ac-2978]
MTSDQLRPAEDGGEARPAMPAHRRYVREVTNLLHRAGFPEAGQDADTGLVTLRTSSEDDAAPSWALDLRAGRHIRKAEYSDALAERADAAGLRWRATVQRRYGHDTGASYVVMTLDQLTAILQRLEPAACTKPSARIRAGLGLDGTDWWPLRVAGRRSARRPMAQSQSAATWSPTTVRPPPWPASASCTPRAPAWAQRPPP